MAGFLGFLGYNTGKEYFLRDFKNAYRFRPDIDPPRQQFQGYVNFIVNRVLYASLFGEFAGGDGTADYRTTISSLVRTADLPSVNFQTETKNAFNRKKIINTGVEYNPVNMSVFDTVGNEWLMMLMKYFSYHYMDPRNKQKGDSRDIEGEIDRIGGIETQGSSFGKDGVWDSNVAGYNPQMDGQFFERIDYVLYHGNKAVQYSIINPKLLSFKPSGIDYSSSEAMGFDLEFGYERFTLYSDLNTDMSVEDLDRFENASGLTGPAFENLTHPILMDDPMSLDKLLGRVETPRTRTAPIPPDKRSGGVDPTLNLSPAEGDRQIGTDTVSRSSNLPDTYGDAVVIAGSNETTEEDKINDILKDFGESVVSAAIQGGNIKDAGARAVVRGVQRIVGTPQSRGSSPTGGSI